MKLEEKTKKKDEQGLIIKKWKKDLIPEMIRACERAWIPISCNPAAKR